MAALRIHSGLFRDVIRLENPLKTQDEAGGHQEEYGNPIPFEAITRGYLVHKDGFRQLEEGTDMLVWDYEIYTWWRSEFENNVNKDTRIIHSDGRVFKIVSYERYKEDRKYYRFRVLTTQ